MPAPTVPWKLVPDSLTIDGDRDSGYRATATFKVDWSDAFTFVDTIMGQTSGTTELPPTWSDPWQFPNSGNAKLYARSFRIKPQGEASKSLGTNKGLIPGEYFGECFIDVTFETWKTQNPQFDPANPITYCEQSVRSAAKMVTRKASGYEFVDGSPVKGDFAAPVTESTLVLTFPRVPFLPWQLVQPYIGKLNSVAIFNCDIGSLLFEGTSVKYVQQANGEVGTQAELNFAYNHLGRDWNFIEKPDGSYAKVRQKGNPTVGVFEYADFRDIFAGL